MFRILQSVAFVAIAIVAWNFAEGYRYGDARVYDWSRPGIEAQFPDGTTKSTVFARLGKASTESQENDVVRWEYTTLQPDCRTAEHQIAGAGVQRARQTHRASLYKLLNRLWRSSTNSPACGRKFLGQYQESLHPETRYRVKNGG